MKSLDVEWTSIVRPPSLGTVISINRRVSKTWKKLLTQEKFRSGRLSNALQRKAQSRSPGASEAYPIASGEGWRAVDIVCTHGPNDHPFEEHFLATSISLVLAGTFVCSTSRGVALMSPGALLLGNPGDAFECSHQHSDGDRCLSFQFEPGLFERIAHDIGAHHAMFERDSLPPLRELARLSARASIAAILAAEGAACSTNSFEDIALEMASVVVPIACGVLTQIGTREIRDEARIARVLRRMAANSDEATSLAELAREAGLSRFHFLRTFKQATGITPHQWLLRARLRRAAERLVSSREPITGIALDVGFDDLSNFIRTFRVEFGVSPSRYRAISK
jgi:AraC family transcriptional regulator